MSVPEYRSGGPEVYIVRTEFRKVSTLLYIFSVEFSFKMIYDIIYIYA
jgi:hypothetical protein